MAAERSIRLDLPRRQSLQGIAGQNAIGPGSGEQLAHRTSGRTLWQVGEQAEPTGSGPNSDVELAASLAAGSTDAFATLYDRYSDRIYSYCQSLCRNPELAADAMQDTFLLAFGRITQLRDPSKLRPWLYAIARNECLRQMRANKRAVDLDRIAEVADVNATVDDNLNAADARALIDEAFAGMNSSDRDVLDLALRQDLDNAAIASVLGVSDNNASAKVSRAKSQLENAVGALLLFRNRSQGCERLDAEVGPDQAFTPLARKRISRHAQSCSTCSKSRTKSVAAIALVGLPLLVAPSWIREGLLNSTVPSTGVTATDASGDLPEPFEGHPQEQSGSEVTRGSSRGDEASEVVGADEAVGASDPIYVAESQRAIPPLSIAERAAQLDRNRPAFSKGGWPLVGKTSKQRWPLVAALVAVAVLMTAAVGVAITDGGEVPAAGQTSNAPIASVSPPPPPATKTASAVPSPTRSQTATKSASTKSASPSASGSSSAGSADRGSSTSKPKPAPKPTTSAPQPTSPTPTPGGPKARPGGPGSISVPVAPTPG